MYAPLFDQLAPLSVELHHVSVEEVPPVSFNFQSSSLLASPVGHLTTMAYVIPVETKIGLFIVTTFVSPLVLVVKVLASNVPDVKSEPVGKLPEVARIETVHVPGLPPPPL